MIIKLSPVRSDCALAVSRIGDILTVNSIALDLSSLPDGATLPASAVSSEFVVNPIERIDGKLIVTLRLPHSADAPGYVRFPDDIVDPPAGQVSLPGQALRQEGPATASAIDWSQVITAEHKAAAAVEQQRTTTIAETAKRRELADFAIAPLQDAVDLDEATESETALLKDWKRYRIALNRLPDQSGYPATFEWPVPPQQITS